MEIGCYEHTFGPFVREERMALIGTNEGAFRCHTIFNCQQVCPKSLDPTGAIARLKMKSIGMRLFGR